VEEVDILSLDTKDIVRFKVHVKSVAMIPPIIEVGVKPFLYDIYFKIDNITDEGWNDDSIILGKRASVDRQGFGDPSFEKSGKKAKNVAEKTDMDDMRNVNMEGPLAHGKESGVQADKSEGMVVEIFFEGDKGFMDNLGNEEDDFNESDDDLLGSQDLEEFAKDEDLVLSPFQEKEKMNLSALNLKTLAKKLGIRKVVPWKGSM
jgi:hypothetical protein